MGLFDNGRRGARVAPSGIVCERCGFDLYLIRKDQIVTIDGKKYCDVCGEYIKKNASAPKYPCAACHRVFPAPEMKSVIGNRVCKECASKYGAGLITDLEFVNDNKVPAVRNSPKPVKKNVPLNAVCVKCGKLVANESTVHRAGDKYYCDLCYKTMMDEYYLKRIGKQAVDIKQALVNSLNAALAKRIRVRLLEEEERIALERLQHIKCASCGSEHPMDTLYLVDDKLYCKECFGKMFKFPNNESKNEIIVP